MCPFLPQHAFESDDGGRPNWRSAFDSDDDGVDADSFFSDTRLNQALAKRRAAKTDSADGESLHDGNDQVAANHSDQSAGSDHNNNSNNHANTRPTSPSYAPADGLSPSSASHGGGSSRAMLPSLQSPSDLAGNPSAHAVTAPAPTRPQLSPEAVPSLPASERKKEGEDEVEEEEEGGSTVPRAMEQERDRGKPVRSVREELVRK